MLTLKNAFRHQNVLKDTIDFLVSYLSAQRNISETTLTHKKNKAVASKDDEIIVSERQYPFAVDDIANALIHLVNEKVALTEAINKAKTSTGFDIDGTISTNLIKRRMLKTFKSMCNIKESVTSSLSGSDYVFNAEGNQTKYYYEIEQSVKPVFDQLALRNTAREIEKEVDDLSNKIDELYISTQVEYTPIINDGDTVEEILKTMIDLATTK